MIENTSSVGGLLTGAQILLSLASLILLIFTSVLSYISYTAQARTGIRESLEQLDDVEINNSNKIKPILHEFDFGVCNPTTSILLKIYKTQYNEAAASIPESATEQIDNEMFEKIVTALEGEEQFEELLKESSVDDDGVHFELATRNAVTARRFANRAMTELREKWLKDR